MSKRPGVRRFGTTFILVVAAASLALFFGGTARASSTIAVHTTAQLVAAVQSGSPGDTILLDAGVQYSPAATLDVTRNLTIETDPAQIASGGRAGIISGGIMTGASTVDPGGNLDIIAIASGQTLTMHNVIITAAIQPSNGAIVVTAGGTLAMDHSLVSANTSSGLDVMSGGQATVTNTTIFNTIQFDGVLLDGNGTFNEDTIAGNQGNGIDNHGGGVASVTNTILSNNALGNCFFAITGAFGSGSNSDDSGTTCGATITTGGASNTGTGVVSSTLTNNGGPTNTLALPTGSVAINHGTGPGAASNDQRGFPRDASPDIGAFEFGAVAAQPMALTVTKIVNNGTTGLTAQPSDFTMIVTDTTTGTVLSSAPGSATGGTPVNVPFGDQYTVTESGSQMNDYTGAFSAGCTGTATNGGSASCTVTNTANPCPQPASQASANTCVNATVNATIIVTAPSIVSFPALAAGETSAPVSVPVNVTANNATGYQLSATRTPFTNGDIPLSISSAGVSAPQVLDLSGLTPIPTASSINLGHNAGITTAAGDAWPFSFVLGPVPFVASGQHQSVVTFTAVAT